MGWGQEGAISMCSVGMAAHQACFSMCLMHTVERRTSVLSSLLTSSAPLFLLHPCASSPVSQHNTCPVCRHALEAAGPAERRARSAAAAGTITSGSTPTPGGGSAAPAAAGAAAGGRAHAPRGNLAQRVSRAPYQLCVSGGACSCSTHALSQSALLTHAVTVHWPAACRLNTSRTCWQP
jgi:hypothetical protein